TGLVARYELADGRDVRQQFRSRCSRHRKGQQPAIPDVLDRRGHVVEYRLHLATYQVCKRGCRTPIWHVDQVDIGHHLEQLAGQMDRGSDTGRGEIDLAGIDLGVGDELGNGFVRKRRVHHQNIGYAKDTRDRRNVADEIEIEVVV